MTDDPIFVSSSGYNIYPAFAKIISNHLKKSIPKKCSDVFEYMDFCGFSQRTIDKYKKIKEANGVYPIVSSRRQISGLVENCTRHFLNFKDINKLVELLFKFIKVKKYDAQRYRYLYGILLDHIFNIKDDAIFYQKIKEIYVSYGSGLKEKSNFRSTLHAEELKDILPNIRYSKYLDIGCGNGETTVKISQLLNVEPYGVDLRSWEEFDEKRMKKERAEGFVFTETREGVSLPYQDSEFDLITVFQTLHHVKELNTTLNEISRVLKKDGILAIREHFLFTNNDKILTDIEHSLYALIVDDYVDHYDKYSARYFDPFFLEYLFYSRGFDCILRQYHTPTIPFEIGPTRYGYLIFRKR